LAPTREVGAYASFKKLASGIYVHMHVGYFVSPEKTADAET
jgi:hypothetical protein